MLILFFNNHKRLIIAVLAGLIDISLAVYSLASPGLGLSSAARFQAKQSSDPNQRVAVLVFHAVGDEQFNSNVMQLKDLEETFQALNDYNYQPISLEQFHAFIDGRAAIPPRAVLLTFDDGYRDVYNHVFPLTKRFNYPAVVFTISKWFDRYPRPENSREHLSTEEAGELLKSGFWQIGGHSYDGHRLVKGAGNKKGAFLTTRAWLEEESRLETEAEYRARVWEDISLNSIALKMAGISEPRDFAFPYGAFNSDLVKMLNEAGYTYLYTNNPGLNRPGQDPSYIRRISAGRNSRETIAILERYFGQSREDSNDKG